MTRIDDWNDVIAVLAKRRDWRSRLRIPKGVLPHPQAVGMALSGGMPEGQLADYRFVLAGGAGLHVKDFGGYYEAHIDEVSPEVNLVEHLRQDAPGTYVGGAAALGAALGAYLSKSWSGALAGAAILGLLGAAMAASAAQDDRTRPRP